MQTYLENLDPVIAEEFRSDLNWYSCATTLMHIVILLLCIISVGGLVSGMSLVLIKGHRVYGASVISTGISCVFILAKEPFSLIKWNIRLHQCAQRTKRIRYLLWLKNKYGAKKPEPNSDGTYDTLQWSSKALMNVRAFLCAPHGTPVPWSYDIEN
jgi:hypothetical protein